MSDKLIFVSAGDPSGDNPSARLLESLQARQPSLSFFGLGGPKMAAAGLEQMADPEDLAVFGFWEVFRKVGYFKKLLMKCAIAITDRRPDAIVLVDYPGFNLRLAKLTRHLGIPIIYYISPQVWAWGKRRLKDITELVDLMLVILPFEEDFYRDSKVNVRFVGHYLIEDIPDILISSSVPVAGPVALLPGSRRQEIARMLAPMLAAASRFNQKHGTRAVVAAIKGRYDYESALATVNDSSISVAYDRAREVVAESSMVVCSSGTATLETAIIGRPMVIIYKASWMTYWVARSVVKLKMIGLANLVMGEAIVPELIQGRATAAAISAALERYRDDDDYRNGIIERLRKVPGLLGGEGASDRAAGYILENIC